MLDDGRELARLRVFEQTVRASIEEYQKNRSDAQKLVQEVVKARNTLDLAKIKESPA